MRELGQPEDLWEKSIGEQPAGVFDPADAGGDRKNMGQEYVCRMEFAAQGRPPDIALEEAPETEIFAKTLK